MRFLQKKSRLRFDVKLSNYFHAFKLFRDNSHRLVWYSLLYTPTFFLTSYVVRKETRASTWSQSNNRQRTVIDNGWKVAIFEATIITGLMIFTLNILVTVSKISKWRRKKSSRTERQKKKTRPKSTHKFSSSPFWQRIVLFICFDFKCCHKGIVPWNMKRAWTSSIF